MKVYVVEFGDYSDRYVKGVYSTRENAEKVGNVDEISEWEVDADAEPQQVLDADSGYFIEP